VEAQDPVSGVGVMDDVERAVTGGHDGRAVDDIRAGDPDERAVAGAGHGAGDELGQREAARPRLGDPRGAEVRRALKVGHRLAESVLLRRGRFEGDRLHRGRVADREVGQLGRIVYAQVVCQPGVGCVQQHVPHGLLPRRAFVRDSLV